MIFLLGLIPTLKDICNGLTLRSQISIRDKFTGLIYATSRKGNRYIREEWSHLFIQIKSIYLKTLDGDNSAKILSMKKRLPNHLK